MKEAPKTQDVEQTKESGSLQSAVDALVSPRLCYIDGCWAYFTTQPLGKQWGDDWDDAPYEHNAGTPYGPHGDEGPWEIIKVAFEADLQTPADFAAGNSRYSVEDINQKAVAWLASPSWSKDKISIHAGATVEEFCTAIKSVDGDVYFKG